MSVPISRRLAQSGTRAAARAAALDVLSFAAKQAGLTDAGLQRPRVHFLFLHRIRPGEEDSFRQLLLEIQRDHRVVTYSEAVARVIDGRIDGRYACFSFDDGFSSCLRAASLLKAEGLAACFFVCPGLVGMSREDLARYIPGIDRVERGGMTWKDLERLLADGHEIGSHTVSHPVLAKSSSEEVARQIFASRDELVDRFGIVRHFAWPRGRFHHFTASARQLVEDAGYVSCASGERGSHPAPAGAVAYPCFRRDLIDLAWPLEHILYFIGRSGRKSDSSTNEWPAGWTTPEGDMS